jgi:hypothetical protein
MRDPANIGVVIVLVAIVAGVTLVNITKHICQMIAQRRSSDEQRCG